MSDGDRNQRVCFFIGTGLPSSSGRVYMVSRQGTILGSVGLEYSPTGMAVQNKGDADAGLVVAMPRDHGRVTRIDHTGRVSTILHRDPALPHPMDVGVAADSDELFVIDNLSNCLARAKTDGEPAEVVRPRSSEGFRGEPAIDRGASVSVTQDKQIIFSNENQSGVYRYSPEGKPGEGSVRMLERSGGVAADPHSSRWAAAQPPDAIHVFNGPKQVKRMTLPDGMVHYKNGLMAFTYDDGFLCVACQEPGKSDEGATLYLCTDVAHGQFERMFRWGPREWQQRDMANVKATDRDVNDFAVGKWMPWPQAILPGAVLTTPTRKDNAGGPSPRRD